MNVIYNTNMDLFTEGQKIALFFQKNSNMVEITCMIEKVYDDRLDLSLPQYFMRYIEFLHEGMLLTAKAFSKLGTIDFNTIVITSPLEETFSIELDYNSIILTSGTSIPVIKAVENIQINNKQDVFKYKTFELSTENIKFSSDRSWQVNEEITGALVLPKDYGIINFKAVITEVDPIYDNEYTAEFTMMTEKDRQTLLYYMYVYSKDND